MTARNYFAMMVHVPASRQRRMLVNWKANQPQKPSFMGFDNLQSVH